MARMKGKSRIKRNENSLVIEQTILPSSWVEFHPAMNWPKEIYGANVEQTMDGDLVHQYNSLETFIPSVPKSWEKIYGAKV